MSKYELDEHTAAIADTEDTSTVIRLGQKKLVGFIFPSGFDGATIGLEGAAPSDTTYRTVKDPSDGTAVSITTGAASSASFINVEPAKYVGLDKIKIKSASAMTADREVIVLTRAID